MKRFLLGLLVGAALVGAVWSVVWAWPRLTTPDGEKIENVVRGTIDGRLHGARCLDIEQWQEGTPYFLSPRGTRLIQVVVIYERDGKVKRMTLPISVEDGAWITPHADVLERLDQEAEVMVDKTQKTKSNPVESTR